MDKSKILEFHKNLKLKRAINGYDKIAVLDSFAQLDKLYQEAHEAEAAALTKKLEAVQIDNIKLLSQVNSLSVLNENLVNDNRKLEDELELLKKSR